MPRVLILIGATACVPPNDNVHLNFSSQETRTCDEIRYKLELETRTKMHQIRHKYLTQALQLKCVLHKYL